MFRASVHMQLQDGTTEIVTLEFTQDDLEKAIGEKAGLLKQAYAVEKTKTEARRKGYLAIEKQTDTGIRLHVQVN